MKARNHIATHLIIIVLLALLYDSFSPFTGLVDSFFRPMNHGMAVLFMGLFFYVIGAILPDADSYNRGSYIYYTRLSVIAYIVRLLEYPLLLITGRRKGHRESLHTIVGIFLSSVVVSAIFTWLYTLIANTRFSQSIFIFWASALFLGQFFHLIEDKISSPNWRIRIF